MRKRLGLVVIVAALLATIVYGLSVSISTTSEGTIGTNDITDDVFLNFSLTNNGPGSGDNITNVTFSLPNNLTYKTGSNISSITNNFSANGNIINFVVTGLFENQTSEWFGFNVSPNGGIEVANATITITLMNTTRNVTSINITTYGVDNQSPAVGLITPQYYNSSSRLNVPFNFTSTDVNGDTCRLYVGTVSSINGSSLTWGNRSEKSGVLSNFVLNISAGDGDYIWNVYCNDTVTHSAYASANYTLSVDSLGPGINNNDTSTPSTQTGSVVYIWANASDQGVGLDTSVLLVDGAVSQTNASLTLTGQVINYSYTLLATQVGSSVNFTIRVNDTLGNQNESSQFITATDGTGPSVLLISPIDNFNSSSVNVTFNWTATDNFYSNVVCNLTIDGVVNVSNILTPNGTMKNQTVTGFVEGAHSWNVSCLDSIGNQNISLTNTFTVDLSAPETAPLVNSSRGVNDSDSDGNVEVYWSTDPNAVSYGIWRSQSPITNTSNATRVANTTGTIFEDNSTLHNEKYFYVVTSIDEAGNENVSVINVSIAGGPNGTANDTILPSIPSAITISNASNVATIRWPHALTDVLGNTDFTGLTYQIWSGTSLNFSKQTMNSSVLNFITNITYASGNSTIWDIPSSCGTTCQYYFVVTTVDDASNANGTFTLGANTANVTLTYTASSNDDDDDGGSSSSGSSGGSSGGSSNNPTGSKTGIVWSSLASGVETTMTIPHDSIALSEIIFTPNKDLSQPGIDIQVKERASDDSLEDDLEVYQYLDITTSNLNDEDVSDITLKFEVAVEWLEDHKIAYGEVGMYHLDGSWEKLETTLLKSTSSSASYEAVTSSFSEFAIAAKARSAIEDDDEEKEETEVPEEESVEEEIVERGASDIIKTSNIPDNRPESNRRGSFVVIMFLTLSFICAAFLGVFYYRNYQ